jgi:HTH-type transcriptional regulator/antitoxin HigA
METLKYTLIKTRQQYNEYCDKLEELLTQETTGQQIQDEIELLGLLIEKWDNEHSTIQKSDPVRIIKSLMESHKLRSKDLSDILDIPKSTVSEILHYKKGLSKEVIRKLAAHFKMSQEAFNRPYKLVSRLNSQLRDSGVMNTPKKLETH